MTLWSAGQRSNLLGLPEPTLTPTSDPLTPTPGRGNQPWASGLPKQREGRGIEVASKWQRYQRDVVTPQVPPCHQEQPLQEIEAICAG